MFLARILTYSQFVPSFHAGAAASSVECKDAKYAVLKTILQDTGVATEIVKAAIIIELAKARKMMFCLNCELLLNNIEILIVCACVRINFIFKIRGAFAWKYLMLASVRVKQLWWGTIKCAIFFKKNTVKLKL